MKLILDQGTTRNIIRVIDFNGQEVARLRYDKQGPLETTEAHLGPLGERDKIHMTTDGDSIVAEIQGFNLQGNEFIINRED